MEQNRGTFVNMISVGGFLPAPWAVAYTASKFGLRGMSQALRGELKAFPDIHICDVYPTFVDTPAISHAGNYTGAKTSVPPGVLDPRRIARAVVRLSDHPRKTTAIGAPATVMKLAQFLAPNLSAAAMDRFMRHFASHADPAPITTGNLFSPPADDGEVDGGFRKPRIRRTATALAAGLAVTAAGGLLVTLRRRGG
jgi:NAD(P)-dependent dehydrogenase (short-subunit alcohol dehydrogenase family)